MALSEAETGWLEGAGAKLGAFEADAARSAEKAAKLAALAGKTDALQGDLKSAFEALTVTFEDETVGWLWWKQARTAQWMTGDPETDIDPVHDLTGNYSVDQDAQMRVDELQQRLLAIQTEMELATGADGAPLFTAKDIERELWTPLLNAGAIPRSAVPQEYSQEAQLWAGACEIYEKKLEEFTGETGENEPAKRMMKLLGSAAQLVGTLAIESMKAANLHALTITPKETEAYEALKAVSAPSEQQLALIAAHEERVRLADIVKRNIALGTLALSTVTGGLAVADVMLDEPDRRRGWKIAEAFHDAVEQSAADLLGLGLAQVTVMESGAAIKFGDTAQYKTVTARISALMSTGFKAGKVVFRAAEIVQSNDDGARRKAGIAMVQAIAASAGKAFAVCDTVAGSGPNGQEVKGTDGAWAKIGSQVEAGIMSAASVGDLVDHCIDCRDEGKTPSKSAILAAVGLEAIKLVLLGRDVMAKEDTPKDGDEEEEEDEGGGLELEMDTLFDAFPAGEDALAAAEAELASEIARQEAEAKAAALEDFRAELRDPAARAAFIEGVQKQVAVETEALDELIGKAPSTPEDLADEARAREANEALDKLIDEAKALNARWDMVNALTAGGSAALVAALPVGGLLPALQKFAMDIAILTRKSAQLNTWIDNLALTFGNNSVYGPAIRARLASARVQRNEQAAKVALDSVGVVAESCKLADLTGVSAAVAIGANMGRALTDFGYKMHAESQVSKGWALYKKARANPGDKKLAREAMRWNSTLAKCVLAYGIVIDGDPIAKEVGRRCGLTPEVLSDAGDVCGKVVTYFETLYSEDPSVLRRIPLKEDWHPGTPALDFESWTRFKTAARTRAVPPISETSALSPMIDKAFCAMIGLFTGDGGYALARDARFPESDPLDIVTATSAPAPRETPEYRDWLGKCRDGVAALAAALKSYTPLNGPCPPDAETGWSEGKRHSSMTEVVESLLAQALVLQAEIEFDLKANEAFLERRRQAREAARSLQTPP